MPDSFAVTRFLEEFAGASLFSTLSRVDEAAGELHQNPPCSVAILLGKNNFVSSGNRYDAYPVRAFDGMIWRKRTPIGKPHFVASQRQPLIAIRDFGRDN